jgi:hypothetical protein
MPFRPIPAPAAVSGASPLGASFSLAAAVILAAGGGAARAECTFLMPIGGSGKPMVQKRISPDRLVGRTNWNTDFAVDRSYASDRINFQSVPTGQGTFLVEAFLRFTDGTNLQVVNENLSLNPGERRVFGPFPAVPGKRTNQVNVRVGSSSMPGSTGFSYRVSVEGCD